MDTLDPGRPGGPGAAERRTHGVHRRGGTEIDIAGIVDLLMSGVSVAVLATDRAMATDLFDQCRRVATAEWFDHTHRPLADRLTDEQLALLLAVRSGDDIEQAARRHHLSARTAARRLADARHALGARSRAEAVSIIGRRIDELRPNA